MVVGYDSGDRASCGKLHWLVDVTGASVECASKDPGKRQHVIYLVCVVRSAGGEHAAQWRRYIRCDLRVGVRHGKHNSISPHQLKILFRENVRSRNTDEYIRIRQGLAQRP